MLNLWLFPQRHCNGKLCQLPIACHSVELAYPQLRLVSAYVYNSLLFFYVLFYHISVHHFVRRKNGAGQFLILREMFLNVLYKVLLYLSRRFSVVWYRLKEKFGQWMKVRASWKYITYNVIAVQQKPKTIISMIYFETLERAPTLVILIPHHAVLLYWDFFQILIGQKGFQNR